MRYVRTEIGFIIDTQNTYPFMISEYMGHDYIDFNSMGRFRIKKESDRIEDLCDRFVLVDKDDEGPIELELIGKGYKEALLELRFRIIVGCDPQKTDLYGAIWTDKGLIYVAKFDWDARGLVLLESHP